MFIKSGMLALRLMPYDSVIDRSSPSGGALVPPEQAREVITEAAQQSAAMTMFRPVSILTNAKSFPVLSGLPTAYFLDTVNNPTSDTSLIQTAEAAWKSVEANVVEIGVIVPIPRRLVSDVAAGGINLTNEVKPLLTSAIARTIDGAVFFGVNKPAAWPDAIVTQAAAAGNSVTASATAAEGGLHSDIIQLMRTVRGDGFMPDSAVGRPTFEFDLLDQRTTTGEPLFVPDYVATGGGQYGPLAGRLMGRKVTFATDGVFPAASTNSDVELVVFDSSKFIFGIREDFNFQVFDTGVITDANGAVVWNLMQQDMLAVRVIFRCTWQVANVVTAAQATEADRFPAGVLYSADETA